MWNGDALEPPVIPAKAGIQSDNSTFPRVCGVDSRFRGNDWLSQITPIPIQDSGEKLAAFLLNPESRLLNPTFQARGSFKNARQKPQTYRKTMRDALPVRGEKVGLGERSDAKD